MNSYIFNPESVYNTISTHWNKWISKLNIIDPKVVVGISGGKDSTVVAGIFTRLLGSDHVYGVSMPCDTQSDIDDVDDVFATLGIKRLDVNIGDAFHSILENVENNAIDVSYDTKTNLPARLRMASLYAVAQSIGGIVLCTANLTESILSYATLYGDHAGSYSPIWDLTVTEVIALGDWLGLPYNLTHKTPIDGLQPLTDEEKLGFTYAAVDEFIRLNKGTTEFKEKIYTKYNTGKFKMDIVNIPHPEFYYHNYVFSK